MNNRAKFHACTQKCSVCPLWRPHPLHYSYEAIPSTLAHLRQLALFFAKVGRRSLPHLLDLIFFIMRAFIKNIWTWSINMCSLEKLLNFYRFLMFGWPPFEKYSPLQFHTHSIICFVFSRYCLLYTNQVVFQKYCDHKPE